MFHISGSNWFLPGRRKCVYVCTYMCVCVSLGSKIFNMFAVKGEQILSFLTYFLLLKDISKAPRFQPQGFLVRTMKPNHRQYLQFILNSIPLQTFSGKV